GCNEFVGGVPNCRTMRQAAALLGGGDRGGIENRRAESAFPAIFAPAARASGTFYGATARVARGTATARIGGEAFRLVPAKVDHLPTTTNDEPRETYKGSHRVVLSGSLRPRVGLGISRSDSSWARTDGGIDVCDATPSVNYSSIRTYQYSGPQ